ncbi:MAG TPA: GntR family transcriptional regulator [Smithellaceae bacterium]|nr:GntR family transcriptional regulator [Smithellaceae bacterium]
MNKGLPGRIHSDMLNDIIKGVYPVASKLPPERELVQKYKASRFAIREAIAMLAQSGFVVTHPQSGTYVRDFNREGSVETLVQVLRVKKTIDRPTIESLLRFRFVTETEAAGRAALHIQESDIVYLESSLERKNRYLKEAAVLAECDYDFHRAVITISGDIISRLVFQSFKPVYSFSAELFYSMEGMSDASLELNLELLKALKRKDQAASGKAMGHILKFAEKKV